MVAMGMDSLGESECLSALGLQIQMGSRQIVVT